MPEKRLLFDQAQWLQKDLAIRVAASTMRMFLALFVSASRVNFEQRVECLEEK
jgi:hypothetical protein